MSRKIFRTTKKPFPHPYPLFKKTTTDPVPVFVPFPFHSLFAFFHSIPTASISITSKCSGFILFAMMSRDARENDITGGISPPASPQGGEALRAGSPDSATFSRATLSALLFPYGRPPLFFILNRAAAHRSHPLRRFA